MQGSSLERGKNKIKGQIPRIYNNGSLKLISVIFAILLWFFVTNYQDPETVLTLNNVPVKILHTEALKAEGKVYIVLDDSDTIPVVTINAPRSVVDALEADNVVATADLYNLTPDNTVPIVLTTNKYSDAITHISGSINQVSLSIEDEKTGTLTITPAVSGSVADGYEIGQITMDQNQVRVTGPASEVNNVASAGVTVDMSDTENSINTYAEIHLYDRDGIDIDIDKNLKLNIDKVMVRVEVLTVKEQGDSCQNRGVRNAGRRLPADRRDQRGAGADQDRRQKIDAGNGRFRQHSVLGAERRRHEKGFRQERGHNQISSRRCRAGVRPEQLHQGHHRDHGEGDGRGVTGDDKEAAEMQIMIIEKGEQINAWL